MEPLKEICTKIAGNTFIENGQTILKTLKENDELKYIREPENKFDKNAIALYTMAGEKIGYIPREVSANLSKYINDNNEITISVSEITGGQEGKKNLGCNICIKETDMEHPEDSFFDNEGPSNDFDDSPFGDYNYHKDNDLPF